MPKLLLYDAAWVGFAEGEGLGLREPQELRVPWGSDSLLAYEDHGGKVLILGRFGKRKLNLDYRTTNTTSK